MQVTEADKAMVRLREVFKERAAAFREAVQLLFGYRCGCTAVRGIMAFMQGGSLCSTLRVLSMHGTYWCKGASLHALMVCRF